jgi:ER membrane protein complex subunit 1
MPTWRIEIPGGSNLVSLSTPSSGSKVASIGRVLGDRSVLYKYLNPHLFALVLATPSDSAITLLLLDSISGKVLHEAKHMDVDTSQGVHAQIVENVVYWTYFSTGMRQGSSRGGRITVAELYESRDKNDRFNMYLWKNPSNFRTEWTSYNDQVPRVLAQTYLFEHPVVTLGTTSTRHGITSRDLLIATPNQLLSIPKRVLDPRRPLLPKGGKLSGPEKEEGLFPYESLIPDERKWTLSHVNDVPTSIGRELT